MGRPFTAPKPLPTMERLLEILSYDEDTGELSWKNRAPSSFEGDEFNRTKSANRWNAIYAGKPAGGCKDGDYPRLMLDRLHHLSHRVIWKMKTGEEPIQIDHIDGDTRNNRFENLRSVTGAVNMRNKALYANSTTGFTGVEYHPRDKVYRAKIGVNGKQIQLGSFKTIEEAIACRIGGQTLADYHENHGRPKLLKGA